SAVSALRAAGCEVKGLVAIFSYGFEVAKNSFKEAKCPFETLTNYDFLIEEALRHEYINEADLESLKKWREDPSNWK
ncbi:MAG: orotate phosphoribosyltransferase, partial [Crocinitomicaceae bacterium]|nr:orotate phosphoribosyltransferase [Crocinitomicaceae bacterium]